MTRGVERGGSSDFQGHKAQQQGSRLGIDVRVSSGGGVAAPSVDFEASKSIPAKCQKEAAKAARWIGIIR